MQGADRDFFIVKFPHRSYLIYVRINYLKEFAYLK